MSTPASAPAAPGRTADLRNYAIVTGAYWADTIADGASRVLVLCYFYELGYADATADDIASRLAEALRHEISYSGDSECSCESHLALRAYDNRGQA